MTVMAVMAVMTVMALMAVMEKAVMAVMAAVGSRSPEARHHRPGELPADNCCHRSREGSGAAFSLQRQQSALSPIFIAVSIAALWLLN